MGELVVDFRVRHVTACRDVEIMDAHLAAIEGNISSDVAGVAHLAELFAFYILQWHAGEESDAVVAFGRGPLRGGSPVC